MPATDFEFFKLDYSAESPELNLAVDEALLEHYDQSGNASDSLNSGSGAVRLWEFLQPTVVLGRGSKIAGEVEMQYCRRHGIPILRRCSGGLSVVGGPGCLMYSLVLATNLHPELKRLDAVHQFVMDRLVEAISQHLPGVRAQGTCDLTWEDRKFSGNSVRIGRNALLYHGTLLYSANLPQIANCLRPPPRQPEYRQQRDHQTFITNLPIAASILRHSVESAFNTKHSLPATTMETILRRAEQLSEERYSRHDWTTRH